MNRLSYSDRLYWDTHLINRNKSSKYFGMERENQLCRTNLVEEVDKVDPLADEANTRKKEGIKVEIRVKNNSE